MGVLGSGQLIYCLRVGCAKGGLANQNWGMRTTWCGTIGSLHRGIGKGCIKAVTTGPFKGQLEGWGGKWLKSISKTKRLTLKTTLALTMEIVCLSEMLVSTFEFTRHHDPEQQHSQLHSCKKLNKNIVMLVISIYSQGTKWWTAPVV
jgi:hypothetical protein